MHLPDTLALLLLACLCVALFLLRQNAKLRRPGRPPRPDTWPLNPEAFVNHYDEGRKPFINLRSANDDDE